MSTLIDPPPAVEPSREGTRKTPGANGALAPARIPAATFARE
jgi:hypothetical protein